MITIFPNKDHCDLQKTDCSFQLPDGSKFELKISSRPIRSNQLTNIKLIGREINYHPIGVDFDGEKMRMGFNRPSLVKVSNDYYDGTFTLPTCTTRKFKWKAVILFQDKQTITYGLPFYFVVSK